MIAWIFAFVGYCFKFLFKSLKYTGPIILIVVAFFGGLFLAVDATSGKSDEFEQELIQDVTHTVTIIWDDTQNKSTSIRVREDTYWNLYGGGLEKIETKDYETGETAVSYKSTVEYYLYPCAKQLDNVPLPSWTKKEGYKFVGLTELPWGGRLYADANGNSLKTITENITLYAQWEVAK